MTTFPLWLLAGLFVAGHLVWGPRWMVDGLRDIWAAYAGMWPRRTAFGDDPRKWAGCLHDVRRDMPLQPGRRAEAAIRALDELRARHPWYCRLRGIQRSTPTGRAAPAETMETP